MNSLEASIRSTKTKGELNILRQKGEVPAIIYGGTEENQKVSLSKKQIKYLIEQENFLSNIINLNIDGQTIKALPREVSFDILTDDNFMMFAMKNYTNPQCTNIDEFYEDLNRIKYIKRLLKTL